MCQSYSKISFKCNHLFPSTDLNSLIISHVLTCLTIRDSFGGCAVAGDNRWTGDYGVRVDLVARTHCSVMMVKIENIKVLPLSRKCNVRHCLTLYDICQQGIMEKFEFFPIKCRILRAQASFQKYNNTMMAADGSDGSSIPQVGYESNGMQLDMKARNHIVTVNFNFSCILILKVSRLFFIGFYWPGISHNILTPTLGLNLFSTL